LQQHPSRFTQLETELNEVDLNFPSALGPLGICADLAIAS